MGGSLVLQLQKHMACGATGGCVFSSVSTLKKSGSPRATQTAKKDLSRRGAAGRRRPPVGTSALTQAGRWQPPSVALCYPHPPSTEPPLPSQGSRQATVFQHQLYRLLSPSPIAASLDIHSSQNFIDSETPSNCTPPPKPSTQQPSTSLDLFSQRKGRMNSLRGPCQMPEACLLLFQNKSNIKKIYIDKVQLKVFLLKHIK